MHAGDNLRGTAVLTPGKMAASVQILNEAELAISLPQGGEAPQYSHEISSSAPISLNPPFPPNTLTKDSWGMETLMVAFAQAGDAVCLGEIQTAPPGIREAPYLLHVGSKTYNRL